ncbi:MAG: DUF3631 domain-containing protein [Candidatus Leucobacter sulfamidivorax]|nr:DUF3631 domain-containing protein [Candidatus Leucobacter sulfamidivorax]
MGTPLNEALTRAHEILARFTVQTSRHEYVAITLWAAYTHAQTVFDFAPRLLITSAEKRSGKSRTMEVVAKLSAHPLIAANATVPAIFRSLDNPRTLFLDEADTIFGTKIKAEQNEDLRGLLNAGFQRGTPVIRTVGPSHVPTEFQVFAPACLAAIGRLPDTIADRAVNIRLRRRKPSERVEQYRTKRNDPELEQVQQQLADAVTEVTGLLEVADPVTPLEDRAADLWEPLLAIADAAGASWPDRARAAAMHLTRQALEEDHEQSEGIDLLTDIAQVLDWVKSDFIPTADLIQKLKGIEESPWRETDLNPRKLSTLLKSYSVHVARRNSARGYKRAALEDAFARYLPAYASQASLPSLPAESCGSDGDASVTGDASIRHPSPIRHPENGGITPIVTEVTDTAPLRAGAAEDGTVTGDRSAACAVCGESLAGRREGTITCSDVCRKRLSRQSKEAS